MRKVYYANISVIFFFYRKLMLTQVSKLNDHIKSNSTFTAGLILIKYMYILHKFYLRVPVIIR